MGHIYIYLAGGGFVMLPFLAWWDFGVEVGGGGGGFI